MRSTFTRLRDEIIKVNVNDFFIPAKLLIGSFRDDNFNTDLGISFGQLK